MSVRRLGAVVCLAAGIALPGLAPAAAPAASKAITLKATAVLPGSATPRTFSMPLSKDDLSGVRVIARPDAATLVVELRRSRWARKNGKDVPVETATCARGTLGVGLVTGQGGPLSIARRLLPQAQAESLQTRTVGGHGSSFKLSLVFRRWQDAPLIDGDNPGPDVDALTDLMVADWRWSKPAQRGQAVVGIHAERLSRTGPCAFEAGVDEDPLHDVQRLWLAGFFS